ALWAILFAIHVGRMQADWTLIGLIAPIVAVAGDVVVAVLLALGGLGPARLPGGPGTGALAGPGGGRAVARPPARAPRAPSTPCPASTSCGACVYGSASIRCATRSRSPPSAPCRWACRWSRSWWPPCPSGA